MKSSTNNRLSTVVDNRTLVEEWPFAYVLNTELITNYCSFCFIRSDSPLQRCSRCRFAHFCSSVCQQSAWSDHRDECRRLANVHPRIPTPLTRLIARVIFKQFSSIGRVERQHDPIWNGRKYEDLMTHRNEISKDAVRAEHFSTLCHVLYEYVGFDHLPPASDLMEIFGKITVNGFSILDDDLNVIGIGLYLGLSILDHSCDPDAFIIFDGPKAILRCLKSPNDIHSLNEIKVSYCDLMMSSSDRQRQLREQYYFDCNCRICKDNHRDKLQQSLRCVKCSGECLIDDNIAVCWQCATTRSDITNIVSLMQQIQWRIDQLNQCDDNNLAEMLISTRDLADQSRIQLSNVNIYNARLCDCLGEMCIKLQRYTNAAVFFECSLPAYERFYPSGHPAIALHLYRCGKLLAHDDSKLEIAQLRLEQAESAFRSSHGNSHRLRTNCLELLGEIREQQRHIRQSKLDAIEYRR